MSKYGLSRRNGIFFFSPTLRGPSRNPQSRERWRWSQLKLYSEKLDSLDGAFVRFVYLKVPELADNSRGVFSN